MTALCKFQIHKHSKLMTTYLAEKQSRERTGDSMPIFMTQLSSVYAGNVVS